MSSIGESDLYTKDDTEPNTGPSRDFDTTGHTGRDVEKHYGSDEDRGKVESRPDTGNEAVGLEHTGTATGGTGGQGSVGIGTPPAGPAGDTVGTRDPDAQTVGGQTYGVSPEGGSSDSDTEAYDAVGTGM